MSLNPDTILLPALLAGGVAIGATVAIERFGGRLGGILATLPTTIVPASLGLWAHQQDPTLFANAMFSVPGGMLLNACFLWLWRALPPHLPARSRSTRLAMMIAVSLGCWGLGAIALVAFQEGLVSRSLQLSWYAWGVTLAILAGGLWAARDPRPAPKGRRRVGPVALLSRGIFAAVAIGSSIALSDIAGPLVAGVAAVFPAIFLTTMVSIWLAQGEDVQAGAVGPMMLGSTSVSVYALASAWLFPALGPALGSAGAWTLSIALVSIPCWMWTRRGTPSASD